MFNGRLIYISTINLSSKKAQSIQVNRFVKVLNSVCREENHKFKAFSLTLPHKNYERYFHVYNKKLNKNRLINNMFMIYYLIKKRDIFHGDILFSRDLLVLFIFALFGFRTVYEFHHPSPFFNKMVFNLYNLLPNSRIATISIALKNYIKKNNPKYLREIIVLPSSVNADKYKNSPDKKICRDQLGMNNDKYYILHTGSPYKEKGLEKFIELCRASDDIFFIHIGGTTLEVSRLKDIAREEAIKNCLFLADVNEELIIRYQKAADLLFYIITEKWPIYWCCSPLKIPEYMASGTPILSSSIGAITEFLDENTSFLFDLNSLSMNNELMLAKLNPELSKQKAKLAKKRVEKKYTWEVRSKLLINFISNTFH